MPGPDPLDPQTVRPPSREERLAAKLRENLRRRKAQSRAIDAAPAGEEGESAESLPKPPPSR